MSGLTTYTDNGEIIVEHYGERFVLVVAPGERGYELLTADYLPVRYAYPVSPRTGRPYSVGNIEPQSRSEGFYGHKSAGWKAPQMRGDAHQTPDEAARRLLAWLDHKAKSVRKAA